MGRCAELAVARASPLQTLEQTRRDRSMAQKTIACALASLLLTGAASAQQNAATALPPDVNPVTLTRLPQLTRADLNDEGKAIYDKIVGDGAVPTTGPVSMSLYSPKVALAINDLNSFLRYNGDLSPRHTEVAICVAAWEIEQQYEYSAHEPAALRYGAPQAVIDTIKYDREPVGLSPEETLIIKLGRAILRDHRVDPALYAAVEKTFGRKGLVELVTVMGDYVMVGMIMTTID